MLLGALRPDRHSAAFIGHLLCAESSAGTHSTRRHQDKEDEQTMEEFRICVS